MKLNVSFVLNSESVDLAAAQVSFPLLKDEKSTL